MNQTVKLSDFPGIPSFGLGTTGYWSGENPGLTACIRETTDRYELTVLDTAEMYGEGRCEAALGKAIRGICRDRFFLVDKILPGNANGKSFRQSLYASLQRLRTDCIDLYLLHWRENADLSYLVHAMESAVQEGLIRHWGVSNFDSADMKDLLAVPHGDRCFCNQVYYSIYERGCEYELLPLLKAYHILPMSYSSLGSGYHPHPDIHKNRAIMELCRAEGITPEAMMLQWNAEHGFCALFSTSSVIHLRENLREIPGDVMQRFHETVDREFPPPTHAYPMVKI